MTTTNPLEIQLNNVINELQKDLKKKKMETQLREIVKAVESELKLKSKKNSSASSDSRSVTIDSMIYPNIIVPDKNELPNLVINIHSKGQTLMDSLNDVDTYLALIKLKSMGIKIPKEKTFQSTKKIKLKKVRDDEDIMQAMTAEETIKKNKNPSV